MNGKIITFRLNVKEHDMLKYILNGGMLGGYETHAEFFRQMIYREFNRRKKLGPPKTSEYQSAFRMGVKENPRGGRPKLTELQKAINRVRRETLRRNNPKPKPQPIPKAEFKSPYGIMPRE